jgi:hypothetical protein
MNMKKHTQITTVIALASLAVMLVALATDNHDSRPFELGAVGFVIGLMMTFTTGTAWLIGKKFPGAKGAFYLLAKLALGLLYFSAFFAVALLNSDF